MDDNIALQFHPFRRDLKQKFSICNRDNFIIYFTEQKIDQWNFTKVIKTPRWFFSMESKWSAATCENEKHYFMY
jgi:hypothetical protein